MSRRIAAVLLLLFVRIASADDQRPRIEALARTLVDGEWVDDLVVATLDKGEARVFGFARKGEPAPDQDTVYEIGSVSKTFTATLLADIVVRGEAKLDDSLASLLPDEVKLPRGKDRAITLLDVATHTSGLPRMPDNFAPKDPTNPYADYGPDRLYAFLAGCKLAREPGAQYEYSNLAMGLLGHAIALRAKKPYEDVLLERVCRPLGMESTRVAFTDDMRKRLAAAHDVDGGPAANWDIPTLAGAGGIRSTARDMLRFLRAQVECDKGPLAEAIRLTHEPKRDFPGGRIGLAWHISKGITWHNGQTGGYHSYVGFDPAAKRGVVVLANSGCGYVDGLGWKVLEVLARKDPAPLPIPATVEVPSEALERYVGRYQLAPKSIFTIRRDGTRLLARLTGQPECRLWPEAETRFYYRVVEAKIEFTVEEGKATKLTLFQNGKVIPAKRIE